MLDLIEEENIGLMDAVRSLAYKPIGDFTALSDGRAQA